MAKLAPVTLTPVDLWALSRMTAGLDVSPDTPVSRAVFDILKDLSMIVQSYRATVLQDKIPLAAFQQVLKTNPHSPMPQKAASGTPDKTQYLIPADDLHLLEIPTYLIENYAVYDKSLNALVGASGGGKSFAALDIAAKIAQKNLGVVIYIAAESVAQFGVRFEAWKSHNKVKTLPNLMFHTDAVNMLDELQVTGFLTQVAECRPRFVVLDTVARCMVGGDENSTRDMSLFVDACNRVMRELSAGLLLVHHVGKDGKMRGSTALFASCDSVLFLRRDERNITIFNNLDMGGKNKFREEGMPMYMDFLPVGESAVLIPTSQIINDGLEKLPTNQRMILEALEPHSSMSAADLAAATGLTKSSLYHALRKLLKAELVTQDEESYSITEKGKDNLIDY